MSSTPPNNFSWVDPGKVAGLALPRMTSDYQYLLDNGIKHLACLCERKPPYYDTCPDLQLHHIKIVDFTPPSPSQIERFLTIVEEANSQGEVGGQPIISRHLIQGFTSIFNFTTREQTSCREYALTDAAVSLLQGVAVHCMHGHGRTGTMLACYLVKKLKISGIDAIKQIRAMRPGSIETHDQEKAVMQFYQRSL